VGVSGSFHLRVRWPTFFITHAQLCHDVMTQAVHVPWCSAGSIPVFKTGGGLKMQASKMQDWNLQDQENYGTLQIS